jgi:hypothetical protein
VDGSTDTRVNPENANRCFEIFLDESAEQTQRVQNQQKKAYTLEALRNKASKEDIRKRHQNIQRLLKPLHVVIPFAHLIQFPADWIRTRRDHDRFLNLIIVIAFLHQYQREQKTIPAQSSPLPTSVFSLQSSAYSYIESSLQDYTVAYTLASSVLWNTFAELDKSTADFYTQLEIFVEQGIKGKDIKTEDYTFTRRQARTHTKIPDYLVKRFMRTLTDLEYLDVKKGHQGSRYTYTIAGSKVSSQILPGLTTPQVLKHKIQEREATIVAPLSPILGASSEPTTQEDKK